MDVSAFALLSRDEEDLLEIFRTYGADGRAISLDSLRVLVPWGMRRDRLGEALEALAQRRLVSGIEEGLRPQGATAFRLAARPAQQTAPSFEFADEDDD